MKRIILCAALLISVMLSCKDDDDAKAPDCGRNLTELYDTRIADPSPPKYPCDYLFAKKNGSDWNVYATTSYLNDSDTLVIYGMGSEKSLGMRLPFTGTGTYTIKSTAGPYYRNSDAYYYTTVGGDVITSYYTLNDTGTVEITEYNETQKLIKGRFHFTLKRQLGDAVPEEMTFTKGEFSVHLPD